MVDRLGVDALCVVLLGFYFSEEKEMYIPNSPSPLKPSSTPVLTHGLPVLKSFPATLPLEPHHNYIWFTLAMQKFQMQN
jgi:hypothetical protein